MAGEKDPFRAAEAQAAEQKQQREQGQQGQHPTTAEFEAYDEEVGGTVEGTQGASAGGPAV
jgi:hypothetical protein